MIFSLLSLFYVVSSNCPCEKYTTFTYCDKNDHCQWLNNSCQKKECTKIVQIDSCKSPECVYDINKCVSFSGCSDLAINDCLEYQGCRADWGTCVSFTKCSELVTASSCGGARTKAGQYCFWDRSKQMCFQFAQCQELSASDCELANYYCDVSVETQSCQIIGYVANCKSLENETKCNERFNEQLCYWMDNQCKRVECKEMSESNCTGTCSWSGQKCMSCYVPDEDDDVTYGILWRIGFVSIVMIVGF